MKSLIHAACSFRFVPHVHGRQSCGPRQFRHRGVSKGGSLRSFRGQAVVLVIARSAGEKEFRREVYRLKAALRAVFE